MLRQPVKIFLLVFLSFLLAVNLTARTRLSLVGSEIPRQLSIGARFIFFQSDSLYLNGHLLERDIRYQFISGYGYFDLSALNPADTDSLVVVYQALPGWLEKSYGRPLTPPPVSGTMNTALPLSVTSTGQSRSGTEINISGAKSFRFSARTAGNSEFSQSLDLKIAGELSPGLEISGSVSDRGYDPAYGTANSRLNEIDRINVRLKSNRLLAQVGDINVNPLSSGGYVRSVSGASFNLDYPVWSIRGAVARPRGLFQTYRFYGQDGFQGPYQIGAGSDAMAIVPGSETVWLDGVQMERGANKDYTFDYVTGRITFNVNRFIDERSRIEIDYEPQAANYKGELFAAGGGVHNPDSTFYMSFDILREGDDRNEPLLGELSESEIALLKNAGDSTSYRSGVVADTSGSYSLVTDSLPDTVFYYVGEGNGEYSITFNYVGSEAGDYKFLGSGRYEFTGSGQGDYNPVIIITAPVRTDYMQAVGGIRNNLIGELAVDIRRSNFDKNLFSVFDDRDNEAWFYTVWERKNWRWHDRLNSLQIKRRVKETDYKSLERINRADFDREYLIPANFDAVTDEILHDIRSDISPLSFIEMSAFFSTLDYKNSFYSRTGGFNTRYTPYEKLTLSGGWKGIITDYEDAINGGDGSGDNRQVAIHYQLTGRLGLKTGYEKDIRKNHYYSEPRGTRFDRLYGELTHVHAGLKYEYYHEDSLSPSWRETLTRHRVTSSVNDRLGNFGYDLSLAYQWLEQPAVAERNFLGRIDLRYQDIKSKLRATSSYIITDEQRNARGITYLEVESGRGNYIYEDGQYVNDPDGNFIRVEEILSDNARVRRGQKTFDFGKDWHLAIFHFNSDIEEELLENGQRSVWWILPFYSDDKQPYLYFSRRYNVNIRFFPVGGFHAVNLVMYEKLEIRDIAGNPRKSRDDEGEFSFKQKVHNSFIDETLSLFKYDRDVYYTGAGVIDGYQVGLKFSQIIKTGEISAGTGYRRAKSDSDERSEIYTITAGSRLRIIERGEIRTDIELYRQQFLNISGVPSYKLTGNRPGERGAEWKFSFNYGVRGGLRINFSLSGKHADNRSARITGRGEVVAGF